ncbi:MAG: cytochrome ubiquinol oxidase subunit I [Vampirovibrionales bacterium]
MFPVWEVPNIGSGWVIGLIAVLHVFISHFAIGGGAFLAFTEQLAYKKNDDRIYDYLKKHSKFFLLLTTVLGAMSGVGIWWAIGLASPNGTQTLLQNFSLFWAVEYIFFALELATFLAYYYTWNKLDRKTHLKLAWIYIGISYFTLFAINGILTFMLNSGGWDFTKGNIGDAFFNPSFWPALGLRMFIMMALAGIYAFFTLSREKTMDADVKAYLLKYSAKWLLPAVILGPLFVIAYLFTLPEPTQQVIINGLSTIGVGNFSIMAKAIFMTMVFAVGLFGMVLAGPYLNPRAFNTTFAVMLLAAGFGFMFTEEWSREMMRKPYVVYNYMYSNGLRKFEVDKVNKDGFFNHHKFAGAELTTLKPNDELGKGQLMFRYQCTSCHTATGNGYRSMKVMLATRDKDAIKNLLTMMKDNHIVDDKGVAKTMYHGYMPPVVGHQDEIDALATYLATLNSDPAKTTTAKVESSNS